MIGESIRFTPGALLVDDALRAGGSGGGVQWMPRHVATDASYLYVVYSAYGRVSKRALGTMEALLEVGTAGSGPGEFYQPHGIAAGGGHVFVANTRRHEVVRLTADSLTPNGSVGDFNSPCGLATDDSYLYVTDTGYNRLAKYTFDLSLMFRGSADFNGCRGIATDGAFVYIADTGNNQIKKYTTGSFGFNSSAGGLGSSLGQYDFPTGIALVGDRLYVADTGNNRIVRITKTLTAETAFGVSLLYGPRGVAGSESYLYVSDSDNNRLVKFALSDLSPVKVGPTETAKRFFWFPKGLRVRGGKAYVCDADDARVVLYDPPTRAFLRDMFREGVRGGRIARASYVAVTSEYILVTTEGGSQLVKFDLDGNFLQQWRNVGNGQDQFNYANGVAGDATYCYLFDYGNNRLMKRWIGDLSHVLISGYIYSGSGMDTDGSYLYIANHKQNCIMKYTTDSLTEVLRFGTTGAGINFFNTCEDISRTGDYVYVADAMNHRIHKRLASDFSYVQVAGSLGSSATQFNYPRGIAADETLVFVNDMLNHRVVVRLAADISQVVDIIACEPPSGSSSHNTRLCRDAAEVALLAFGERWPQWRDLL